MLQTASSISALVFLGDASLAKMHAQHDESLSNFVEDVKATYDDVKKQIKKTHDDIQSNVDNVQDMVRHDS